MAMDNEKQSEGKDIMNPSLISITLKPEYNTEDDDIIREFYAPCLKVSKFYDRAIGYFRANIYRELGEDLLNFVIAGGKVRIVCSPDIPVSDEDAAREGYALRNSRSTHNQEASLVDILEVMSNNPKESDCLEMLRLLIECGSLDLFIATRIGGIYHRKIGAFYDAQENIVAFSGSGNETQMAISSIEGWGNDEEFDVYRSWGNNFESSKALKKMQYLHKLFSVGTKHTKVRPLNEVEREVLARFRSHKSFEDCRPGAHLRTSSLMDKTDKPKYTPYYYQRQAINAWNNAGKIGMFLMATGTGKTITALFAISSLIQEGKVIVILVPSKILLSQWNEEIRYIYPHVPILLAGGGYDWKAITEKRMYVSKQSLPRIILATMSTAATGDFIKFLQQAENPVLVADEVHRLGSPINRRIIMEIQFKERLGLSATPERLFDPEGDNALKNAFGTEPVFYLPLGGKVRLSEDDQKDVPILGKFLSRYNYFFEVVHLNLEEQGRWDELTSKIKIYIAKKMQKNSNNRLLFDDSGLQNLLIQRARILKHAEAKVDCAYRIVSERYPADGRWIIYCEDEEQLRRVTEVIRNQTVGINVVTYYSKMDSTERDRTLGYFEQHPSIIVSIRCLDEGVDIPEVDGAIILASSKNPREYIQRRGRVLRKAKGKQKATIIDAIVLPNSVSQEDEYAIPIVRGELARAWKFAQLAENQEVTHKLWRLAQEYGVDIESDAQIGLQDDVQEE
ncbi:MAG: DEAD/DEAH box helicase family protein [Candidatus Methanoperedens sp.]|nr:DEAD/DEAH box helicase family protein [Candidatus Methanoperedens sp.]MCZ7394284.1 DEAD/DEAH box helicase family protein [Candidatus Methanoperedens sp.]